MTGHVFHPGHQELHGITVVLETTGSEVYIGRFDREDDAGVHLVGVSVFSPVPGGPGPEDFVTRTARFGVRVDRPHVLVHPGAVRRLATLSSLASA